MLRGTLTEKDLEHGKRLFDIVEMGLSWTDATPEDVRLTVLAELRADNQWFHEGGDLGEDSAEQVRRMASAEVLGRLRVPVGNPDNWQYAYEYLREIFPAFAVYAVMKEMDYSKDDALTITALGHQVALGTWKQRPLV
jgi:hypothetical protein